MNNLSGSFSVTECVSTAWEKTYGAKGTFMAAMGLVFLISIVGSIISGAISGVLTAIAGSVPTGVGIFLGVLGIIIVMIVQFFIAFLGYGMIYIGIQRAKNAPITYKQIFYIWNINLILRIVGLYIILSVICIIPLTLMLIWAQGFMGGSMLVNLFGALLFASAIFGLVYISIRLGFSLALILDKDMEIIPCIKKSWSMTADYVWDLLGLFLINFAIMMLGTLLLGIGLIWAIPYSMIAYGVAYLTLLNVNAHGKQ